MALVHLILGFVGLTVVLQLWVEERRGFAHGCLGFQPSERIDCAAVTSSPASRLLGVSNITWGALFYATVVALSFARLLGVRPMELFDEAVHGLVLVGTVYTAYLVWYQHAVVRRYCPLCMASALTVLALFVTSAGERFGGWSVPGSTTVALLVVGLWVAWAGWTLAKMRREETTVERPLMAGCGYDPVRPFVDRWETLVDPSDPAIGPRGAPVTVIEFLDPNCPHCRAFHPEMMRTVAALADRVRFVFKPVPLWDFSVPQIEVLYVAAEHGRFLEMLTAQFAVQRRGGLSPQELIDLAAQVGIDPRAILHALRTGRHRRRVLLNRELARRAGILGVPTVLVNGKVVAHTPRSMRAECLVAIVEAELAAARRGGPTPRPARRIPVHVGPPPTARSSLFGRGPARTARR